MASCVFPMARYPTTDAMAMPPPSAMFEPEVVGPSSDTMRGVIRNCLDRAVGSVASPPDAKSDDASKWKQDVKYNANDHSNDVKSGGKSHVKSDGRSHVKPDGGIFIDNSPPPPLLPDSDNFFQEANDYLARTSSIMARLAVNLTKGPHVDKLTHELHRFTAGENTGADIGCISTQDIQWSKARKIRDLSLKFSKEVHAICYPESPWELGQDLSMDQMRTLAEMTRYQGSAVRDFCTKKPVNKRKAKVIHAEPERPRRRSASPEAEESSSGGDSDDEATFKKLNDDLTLRRRGKGSYTCPKGRRCKKGGVDSTGEPIQFDRNSAFLQHVNKHSKPWRCNLPGCPNSEKKRRFARRDGLLRHQKHVEHVDP